METIKSLECDQTSEPDSAFRQMLMLLLWVDEDLQARRFQTFGGIKTPPGKTWHKKHLGVQCFDTGVNLRSNAQCLANHS